MLLVDARKGVLTQTRRHAYIVHLLGIRNVVLAINKIDLVDFSQARFDQIVADFTAFAADLGFAGVVAIPLSARYGDNLTEPSPRTPWYDGPTLLGHLETVPVGQDMAALPFRMPVQWVNRPDLDFRGLSGTIAGVACARATRWWWPRPARRRRWRASSPPTATWPRRTPARRSR